MNAKTPLTAELLAEEIRSRLDVRGDLCDLLPWPKAAVLRFADRHGDELATLLGRRLIVRRAKYVASGSGAFGRNSGRRANRVAAGLFVE